MSSANRRLIKVTGAFPGRNPGTRATRANSLATRATAFCTSSAGISSSSSRRQVASVIVESSFSQFSQVAYVRIGLVQIPPGNSEFYSLPLLGSGKRKRERTGSGDNEVQYRGIKWWRQQ